MSSDIAVGVVWRQWPIGEPDYFNDSLFFIDIQFALKLF
jgi:hypothetical protein